VRSQDGVVYLSTAEAGKELNVGPARVRQLVYLKKFSGVVQGWKKTLWIPEDEVKRFKATRPWNEKLVPRASR
jgi:hypothetical protein